MKTRKVKRRHVAEPLGNRPSLPSEPEEARTGVEPICATATDDSKPQSSLEDRIGKIAEVLGHSEDLVISRLLIMGKAQAALAYIDGLIDRTELQQYLIKGLTTGGVEQDLTRIVPEDLLERVRDSIVPTAQVFQPVWSRRDGLRRDSQGQRRPRRRRA